MWAVYGINKCSIGHKWQEMGNESTPVYTW